MSQKDLEDWEGNSCIWRWWQWTTSRSARD